MFLFCSQGLLRFYDAIIQGVLRHVNFDGEYYEASMW